jgi:lipopolysaccharide/colanic/teichoic acid biosynthesis glycosyltransferase
LIRSGSSWAKRGFDLFLAIPGFLLLAPLFYLVALGIKLDSPGPVFFRQERVGLGGKIFRLVKFRSMRADAEKLGSQLTVGRDPRITKFGAMLRATKVDELPQLFNVLNGDMSLVGPRPEVFRYVVFYTPEQRKVLELLPGITDPASLKYRHENDILAQVPDPENCYIHKIMPEKIEINLAYARQAGLGSDLKVVMKTIACLCQ